MDASKDPKPTEKSEQTSSSENPNKIGDDFSDSLLEALPPANGSKENGEKASSEPQKNSKKEPEKSEPAKSESKPKPEPQKHEKQEAPADLPPFPKHAESPKPKKESHGSSKERPPAKRAVQVGSGSTERATELVNSWLKQMVEKRASDLHVRAGTPVIYRVDGNLVADEKHVLNPDLAKEALYVMLTKRQRMVFEARHEVDFSYALRGYGRFRGNAFRQRGSVAIVLRQIPTKIPTFTDLQLPAVMGKFCKLSRGLVLVCGPTGSGKSTTLAAGVESINQDRSEHIVTIEDPIEFLYRDKKSIISQRELGSDTISFVEALKHVLRQDPDVILLGEMRDLETTQTAITAAQTGHLVFSTLHTTDAVQTINRIVDLYPPHQQTQVRLQLADVLKGVVCQRLLPHVKGVGRVPACEVLVVTALVRKAIAENQMQDVSDAIRQGKYYGMQTFHQSLLGLYKEGKVSLEEALDAASNPEELMMAIRGITPGGAEGVQQV